MSSLSPIDWTPTPPSCIFLFYRFLFCRQIYYVARLFLVNLGQTDSIDCASIGELFSLSEQGPVDCSTRLGKKTLLRVHSACDTSGEDDDGEAQAMMGWPGRDRRLAHHFHLGICPFASPSPRAALSRLGQTRTVSSLDTIPIFSGPSKDNPSCRVMRTDDPSQAPCREPKGCLWGMGSGAGGWLRNGEGSRKPLAV